MKQAGQTRRKRATPAPKAQRRGVKGTVLDPRQRAFAIAYAASGNATAAAIEAGYAASGAKKRGCLLLVNPLVAALIKELATKNERAGIMSARRRQEMLTEFAEDVGNDIKDRIKSIEVLGRMMGDFIERREVEHSGATVHVYLPDNGRDDA